MAHTTDEKDRGGDRINSGSAICSLTDLPRGRGPDLITELCGLASIIRRSEVTSSYSSLLRHRFGRSGLAFTFGL